MASQFCPIDHLTLRGKSESRALVLGPLDLTFAGLELKVAQLSGSLIARGLEPGDRVASWLFKTEFSCLMPLAAPRAGLIHVPINPALRCQQVGHILSDCGASVLVTSPGLLRGARGDNWPAACQIWLDDALSCDSDPLPPSDRHPDDLAAIFYTSGSTGRAKGVVLSHANLWLGAASVALYLGLDASDRTLAVLPLAFDYGQNQLFSTWFAGAAAYPLEYLLPRDVYRAIDRWKITTLAGVPPLLSQLTAITWKGEPITSLRRVTNSGGALTRELIEAIRTNLRPEKIFAMYGLTEAFRATFLPPDLLSRFPTSIGRAIPFAEVFVVRPDGSRAELGEPGELVQAGPLVAQGYWRDPVSSSERFRPAPPDSLWGGRAVWSGDIAVEREQGLLYFVGRSDDMIKSSGYRISPTEIEEIAMASGTVTEVAAFGVPDCSLGEVIVLLACAKKGVEDADVRIQSHLKAELPSFMQPSRIEWRSILPRSPNGKIDRASLKRELAKQSPPARNIEPTTPFDSSA
jgi:acyl-CoA ligase (AMP-forming) (exosortase A-associated)